jgi:hypothetical protein
MTGPTDAQLASAHREVLADLERQDARSPRDAALASLGAHATETQISDWIARFRPEALHRSTA